MKDKFLGSLRNNFKQLDFFVTMVVFLALTDLLEWTFLQSLGIMLGCVFLSVGVGILLKMTRETPKLGRFFYAPCENCGKSSSSHTLLGTFFSSLAKPHFFLIFIAYFFIRWLDEWTFTKQIVIFSGIIVFTLLSCALIDILGAMVFKRPEASENT